MKRNRVVFTISGTLLVLLLLCISCGGKRDVKLDDLIVFHAACFSPVINSLRSDIENDLRVLLRTEPSGSQVVCRKVTELGRECDLMMVADSRLLKQIVSSSCNWRIEFAHDEIVLGVGTRALKVDKAERDWVSVLADEDVILGRVDEDLGPVGYRTLLVWELTEQLGHPGLKKQLTGKCEKVLDDVSHLAALLSSGDIHYGFLYRSTCINYDIRYISLDPKINLGDMATDYSHARVTLGGGASEGSPAVTFKGSLITYALTIPSNAPNKERTVEVIEYLIREKAPVFEDRGFSMFKPRFYGSRDDYAPFEDIAEYAGEF